MTKKNTMFSQRHLVRVRGAPVEGPGHEIVRPIKAFKVRKELGGYPDRDNGHASAASGLEAASAR